MREKGGNFKKESLSTTLSRSYFAFTLVPRICVWANFTLGRKSIISLKVVLNTSGAVLSINIGPKPWHDFKYFSWFKPPWKFYFGLISKRNYFLKEIFKLLTKLHRSWILLLLYFCGKIYKRYFIPLYTNFKRLKVWKNTLATRPF